jgi:hypothetical protein
MNDGTFDAFARQAGTARDRRSSLKALGAAALVAAAGASQAQAGKKGKKAKKKCRKQQGACQAVVAAFCAEDETCEQDLFECCALMASCNATAATECFIDVLVVPV